MGDGLYKTKLGFELRVSSSRSTREAVVAGRGLIGLPHFLSKKSLFVRLAGRQTSTTRTYLVGVASTGDQQHLQPVFCLVAGRRPVGRGTI